LLKVLKQAFPWYDANDGYTLLYDFDT